MPFENKKQLLIIVGAVAIGIVAVLLTSNYVKSSIQGQTNALAEKYDAQQKQLVGELQRRSEEQAAALAQEIERVKSQEAQDAQRQEAALQAAQQQEARLLQQQQQAQQVAVKVAKPKPSLAIKTPVGKRAVTVQINSLSAVGGLINAGDFVDVIAQLSVPSGDSGKSTVTAVIFQGLEVLAINTNLDEPGAYDAQQGASYLKVTFAVDPQEAGLLAFANNNGSLELALRSPDENERLMLKANTWKTLADYVLKNQGIDIQNPDNIQANKPEEETKPEIEIFRGGKEL